MKGAPPVPPLPPLPPLPEDDEVEVVDGASALLQAKAKTARQARAESRKKRMIRKPSNRHASRQRAKFQGLHAIVKARTGRW